MARYYDMDKLADMLRAKADTLIEGKEAFLYVAKWLDLLPAADVPKEIFTEIDAEIGIKLSVTREFLLSKKNGRAGGKTITQTRLDVLTELNNYFSELKKKYTEG